MTMRMITTTITMKSFLILFVAVVVLTSLPQFQPDNNNNNDNNNFCYVNGFSIPQSVTHATRTGGILSSRHKTPESSPSPLPLRGPFMVVVARHSSSISSSSRSDMEEGQPEPADDGSEELFASIKRLQDEISQQVDDDLTYFSSDYEEYKAKFEEEYPEIKLKDFIKNSLFDLVDDILPSEESNFDANVVRKLNILRRKKTRNIYAEKFLEQARGTMASAFLKPDRNLDSARAAEGLEEYIGQNHLMLNAVSRYCESLEKELERYWPGLKRKGLEDLPKLLNEVPIGMKKSSAVEKLEELLDYYKEKKSLEGNIRRESKVKEFILLSQRFKLLVKNGPKKGFQKGPEKGFQKGPQKGKKKRKP